MAYAHKYKHIYVNNSYHQNYFRWKEDRERQRIRDLCVRFMGVQCIHIHAHIHIHTGQYHRHSQRIAANTPNIIHSKRYILASIEFYLHRIDAKPNGIDRIVEIHAFQIEWKQMNSEKHRHTYIHTNACTCACASIERLHGDIKNWQSIGRMHFPSIFIKWTFRAHTLSTYLELVATLMI